jgi:hypothetical protein
MRTYHDRFIVLKKPEKNFLSWYKAVQELYNITPYLAIEKPDPYLMQSRHMADDGSQYIFFINSSLNNSYQTGIVFSGEISRGRYGWVWDPESGKKYRIKLSSDNGFNLDLGPAESVLFVFNHERKGPEWHPLPPGGNDVTEISSGWSAEFRHCRNGFAKEERIDTLNDLKEMPDFINFSGTIIYRNTLICKGGKGILLNLGKVYGTSELKINGISCGVKWYGRRIFSIDDYLHIGKNSIEITVTTSMGNYMKSLTDNPIAQYWTNAGNKNQPLQSMGLIGPVIYYRS